ncbi:MAG: hypothetical protein V4537_17435 [Pseudomonadota bacterium]
MTNPEPTDPTALDQAEAAQLIQDAGVADESAAYVNGGDVPDTDTPDAVSEPEAHPS